MQEFAKSRLDREQHRVNFCTSRQLYWNSIWDFTKSKTLLRHLKTSLGSKTKR